MDSAPPPLDLSADTETSLTSACSTPKQSSSALPSSTTLDEEDGRVEKSGAVNAASRLQSVANIALRPKVYLGFAPLTSMFRRTASLGGKSAATTPESNGLSEPSGHGQTSSEASSGSGSEASLSSSSSSSTEESEGSTYSEDEEDAEDDRRTIRGVSAPVTPVEGPKFGIGNGKIPNEEKLNERGEEIAESAVDAVAVFVST